MRRCPHCGYGPVFIFEVLHSIDGFMVHKRCCQCSAMGPGVVVEIPEDWCKKASQAWDRREAESEATP